MMERRSTGSHRLPVSASVRPIAEGSLRELAFPQSGADHGDRRRVSLDECAARERRDAEQRKEVPIGGDDGDPLVATVGLEQLAPHLVAGETLDGDALRAKLLKVAKVHGARAANSAKLRNLDEPIGRLERQRPQQHAIHDAEDGGRGAGYERQGRNRHGREAGTAP